MGEVTQSCKSVLWVAGSAPERFPQSNDALGTYHTHIVHVRILTYA